MVTTKENTSSTSTEITTPAFEAKELIENLKKQASDILGSALSTPLSAFQVGALGNFSYYWQDPSNLEFNEKTYQWISANLMARTQVDTPAGLDQSFLNYYIGVLSKISYSLSSADQAKLNAALKNATDQQLALLNAWKAAYGKIPAATATQQPIDVIITTIATTWAQPSTTLTAMQQSKNLKRLLNNTPASGQPILPVLANYLNAIGSSISLLNATTMNTGYIAEALEAVQYPTVDNGALTTNDGQTQPAYQVSTPLSTIINGLSALDNAIEVDMTVTRSSSNEFKVSISGDTSFSIPVLDFLTISTDASANYFSDKIATSQNDVTINMKFTGVTLVNYGPVAFNASTGKNWYWPQPIIEAIKNKEADVSGFKFTPVPDIDFSEKGPFGFLTGVAISNYPTITITVKAADYNSIQKTFEQTASLGISFLGIRLGGASESTYSHSTEVDSSSSTVTITFAPPADLVAGANVDAIGWVLGAQVQYPAS